MTQKPKHAVGTLHAKAGALFLDPVKHGGQVAVTVEGDDDTRVANAERLAHCWNHHQDLFDALRWLLNATDDVKGLEGCTERLFAYEVLDRVQADFPAGNVGSGNE